MLFSEANQNWKPIPEWAEFLIQFGYRWPNNGTQTRRIALISMPCDSAAAGLITIGALIRDLECREANDIDGYYDALLKYARQFLEHGRGNGRLRSASNPRLIYEIDDSTDFENRTLAFSRGGVIYRPNPKYATDWHIDGEPPPQWTKEGGELSDELYRHLVPEAAILPENLGSSYSGLCLSGRATGANASREICASVRFRNETAQHGLDDLLTVYGWSNGKVSRISFYNALTERLDRSVAATPALVVADGAGSFLKIIGNAEFLESDIIGVIHRTMEREKLEAVGSKILPNQWYTQDGEVLRGLSATPRGISISVLRRNVDVG
jgi:hypothetical protein